MSTPQRRFSVLHSRVEVSDGNGEGTTGTDGDGSAGSQGLCDIDIAARAGSGWPLDVIPDWRTADTQWRSDNGMCLHMEGQAHNESKSEKNFGEHVERRNERWVNSQTIEGLVREEKSVTAAR